MNLKTLPAAVLSGILMTAIFPAINLGMLAWVCLVPLLFSVEKKGPYQSLLLGCITGTVFNCGLVYWVVVSMTTYGELSFFVAGALLFFLSVFLGFFVAVPVCLSSFVKKTLGLDFFVTLPFFWTACEHIKSWFLTGFPWENLGYAQFQYHRVIQIADITGVYGITFLIVLTNGALFCLLKAIFLKQKPPLAGTALTAVLIGAILVYGGYRINEYNQPGVRGKQLKVFIVQPSIPQNVKWDGDYLDETLRVLRRITLQGAFFHPDIVLWPESSTPFYFQSEAVYKKHVRDTVVKSGAYLLFGSPAWERNDKQTAYFNSAFLLSPQSTIMDRYDKIHLVPYGEYVPLKKLFPFINKMVAGIGDFSPGRQPKNLCISDQCLATLICYEIIFPDLVRRFTKDGAHFLVNITNDAWFGRTSAPYQHLSMAVLRAVENKRYLVRAANTGISACIDPTGVILQQSKLFTQEGLPAIIFSVTEQTFYTCYGDIFAFLCYGISILLIFPTRIQHRQKPVIRTM